MPITLTADTVAELRIQAADLFPQLAATVPVNQAPTSDAKDLLALREQHNAAVADLNEANVKIKELRPAAENLAKLEAVYSAQAEQLREAQAALQTAREGAGSDYAAALGAIAEVCDILGSPRDIAAAPALVREVKAERDQAQAALKEAQETLESTSKEIKRLQELVGTPGEEKKTPRKRTPKASAEEQAASQADAAAVYADRGYDAAGNPVTFPDSFTNLLDLPWDVENGTGVIIAIQSDGAPDGWTTPGGIVERRFDGTDRYEVKLVQGGYHTVHRAAMRAVPEAPAPLERAPVTPLATPAPSVEATPDPLVTDEDRRDLGTYAQDCGLNNEAMKALIAKLFKKASSAELTVSELATLRAEMRLESEVPF